MKSRAWALVIICLLAGSSSPPASARPGEEVPLATRGRSELFHADYGPPYRPAARVEVLGFARTGQITLRDGIVPLVVTSQRSFEVHVHLTVEVQAHGTRASVDRGRHLVRPGASSRFNVPVSALGVTPARLQTPAILTIRTQARNGAGDALGGTTSRAMYMHATGSGELLLYDEATLLRRFKGGDLAGLFVDRSGRDAFPGQTKLVANVGHGDPDPWAPPPVLTSGQQTICVHWNYQSSDHGAGEQYYPNGEPIAARGVKLSVFQQGVGPSGKTLWAHKDSGCVSTPVVPGHAVQVAVSAEARFGVDHTIHVRTFESPAAAASKSIKKWVYYALPGPQPLHLYIPAGVSSTIMALGSFSAWMLDQRAPVIAPNPVLDLVYVDTKKNSSADETRADIAPSQGDSRFVYGHEVGHWYSMNQDIGFDGTPSYPGHDACWSDDSDVHWHLLRSAEVNIKALNEALGHFFSTVIWNGPGWPAPHFRYYKDMSGQPHYADLGKAGLVDMAAPTDSPLTPGGIRNWRDTMCVKDSDTDSKRSKFSVELDWARFLMNYVAGDAWAVATLPEGPTFRQLIDHLRHAYWQFQQKAPTENNSNLYDTYHQLLNALKDPDFKQTHFVDRFVTLAALYGVDSPHEQPSN